MDNILNDNSEAQALLKVLLKLIRKSDKLHKEILSTREKLMEICIHTDLYEDSENYSGDYYNVAQYHKIIKCNTCGKELKRNITYGGFG